MSVGLTLIIHIVCDIRRPVCLSQDEITGFARTISYNPQLSQDETVGFVGRVYIRYRQGQGARYYIINCYHQWDLEEIMFISIKNSKL